MGVTSVEPYWELTFDADGDPDPAQRDALLTGVRGRTDLVLFSHGWNNDLSTADALYDRFFGLLPGPAAHRPVRLRGPALAVDALQRRADPRLPAPGAGGRGRPGLDPPTRAALARVFPGAGPTVDRISALLAERPEDPSRLAEFAGLVRDLTGLPAGSPAAAFAQDFGPASAPPALLTQDPVAMCGALADALERAGAPVTPRARQAPQAPQAPPTRQAAPQGRQGPQEPALLGGLGGLGGRIWDGAKELLRQATYFAMKRRAGTVGRLGLGPLLGQLAREAPQVRVHLVGHSFGGRLVAYALAGLPPGVKVASVTFLQGAFSHYAFTGPFPFDAKGGALHGMQHRVAGPLVACHSRHDQALGVFYPLASRLSDDDRSLLGAGLPVLGPDSRWGALGHDGFQDLPGTTSLPLDRALAGPLPAWGCVSVDASAVVCAGGPPSGAHSDICHEELARLVLHAAGQEPAARGGTGRVRRLRTRPAAEPSAVRGEFDDLLVGRAVLPADPVVRDAAERPLHDRVGAPLVAGRAAAVVARGRRWSPGWRPPASGWTAACPGRRPAARRRSTSAPAVPAPAGRAPCAGPCRRSTTSRTGRSCPRAPRSGRARPTATRRW